MTMRTGKYRQSRMLIFVTIIGNWSIFCIHCVYGVDKGPLCNIFYLFKQMRQQGAPQIYLSVWGMMQILMTLIPYVTFNPIKCTTMNEMVLANGVLVRFFDHCGKNWSASIWYFLLVFQSQQKITSKVGNFTIGKT